MSHQEQPTTRIPREETIINARKLAALDIAFLGSRFIIAEYALGVVLCAALGAFSIFAFFRNPDRPPFMIIIGIVLLWIALNYVPMLLYAISITRHKSAKQEVAFEIEHRDIYMRRYRRKSLWLLLPLVVPILAILQEVQKRNRSNG